MGKKIRSKNKIFEYVITLTIVVILSVLTITTISSSRRGENSILGLKFYVVLSGSMSPTIKTGSLIILKPINAEKIVVGDIITFNSKWSPNNLTTHRVIKMDNKKELRFITKGDANKVQDSNPVFSENIRGKVILCIPYVGYIINFLRTPKGFFVISSIIVLSIVINKFYLKNKKGD